MEAFDGQIRIFESVIPNTVKVGESIYYSKPLVEYAPGSKACEMYPGAWQGRWQVMKANSPKRKVFQDALGFADGGHCSR